MGIWKYLGVRRLTRISVVSRKILWCKVLGFTLLLLSLVYALQGTALVRRSRLLQILASYDDYSFRLPSKDLREAVQNSSSIDSKTKWIILTSPPAAFVMQFWQFSSVPNWTVLVVVRDDNTPKIRSHPNVKFLDLDEQLKLRYKTASFLHKNKDSANTRKIIGYLYAIQHGAKFIYDATYKHIVDASTFENGFALENSTRGLILNDTTNPVINPHSHFGQPNLYPPGFPSDYIVGQPGSPISNSYIACKMKTPLIQPMLSGSNIGNSHGPAIEFDSSAPPLILPKSVVAPFNSESTLFHYDSFWALLIPFTVTEDADIWRGYWSQPLLWSIGSNLGFFHHGNSSSHSNKYFSPESPSTKLSYLIKFLQTWSCAQTHIYECMLSLTTTIIDKGMYSPAEMQLLRAWILDLKNVGYQPPDIQISNIPSTPCLLESTYSDVIFHGRDMQIMQADQVLLRNNHLKHFCNLSTLPIPQESNSAHLHKRHYFPSTLLVVVFNEPHYDNIWLLDLIYRAHFPNLLYCGPLDDPSVLTVLLAREIFKQTKMERISFVRANTSAEDVCFNYECALRAIDMNYNVDGYLLIQDDVLLNIWNIDKYDKTEAWVQRGQLRHVYIHLEAISVKWLWWISQFGHSAMKDVLTEIYNKSRNVHVKQFQADRDSYGFNATTAVFSESELFYFPAAKKELVYEIGSILRHFEVYLEIAVPFIQTGLSSPESLVIMPGKDLWDKNRMSPLKFFNKSKDWLHPVKHNDIYNSLASKNKLQHFSEGVEKLQQSQRKKVAQQQQILNTSDGCFEEETNDFRRDTHTFYIKHFKFGLCIAETCEE